MAYDESLLLEAHRASSQNRDAIEKSSLCACFDCLVTLEPCVISNWTDPDSAGVPRTPLCPSCGTDAILGNASGYSQQPDFLVAMHERFCATPDAEPESHPEHADFASVDEALAFLSRLGATPWLLRHVELVGEAAEALLTALDRYELPFDGLRVRLGVVFHDAGKLLHPSEMSRSGDLHETSGERLLLAHGVDPALARICLSHARWDRMEVSLEELLVALADKLWKGVRVPELEKLVIDVAARHRGVDSWDLYVELDSIFESVAADGDARLTRSAASKGPAV